VKPTKEYSLHFSQNQNRIASSKLGRIICWERGCEGIARVGHAGDKRKMCRLLVSQYIPKSTEVGFNTNLSQKAKKGVGNVKMIHQSAGGQKETDARGGVDWPGGGKGKGTRSSRKSETSKFWEGGNIKNGGGWDSKRVDESPRPLLIEAINLNWRERTKESLYK